MTLYVVYSNSNNDKVFKFYTSKYILVQVYLDIRRRKAIRLGKLDETLSVLKCERGDVESILIDNGIDYVKGDYTLHTNFTEDNFSCEYKILFEKEHSIQTVYTDGELKINPPTIDITFQKYPLSSEGVYIQKDNKGRYYIVGNVTYNRPDYHKLNELRGHLIRYHSSLDCRKADYESIAKTLLEEVRKYQD